MRLTGELRERIAKDVLQHRFAAEIEKIVQAKAALADDVYNDVYKKADREKMAALPNGWLPEVTACDAKFGDKGSSYERLQFTGGVHGILSKHRVTREPADSLYRRCLAKHKSGCWKVYEDSHRLSLRYTEITAQTRALSEQIQTARQTIETMLGSVTTLAALLKAWPEVAPFVATLKPVEAKLPAIPVQSLNAMFKLPVKEAA